MGHLVLPEPSEVARRDPVRLVSCVRNWQNLFAFGAEKLSRLGKRLVWQVQQVQELPLGGLPQFGFRLPSALVDARFPSSSQAGDSREQAAAEPEANGRSSARFSARRGRRGGPYVPARETCALESSAREFPARSAASGHVRSPRPARGRPPSPG